ncbi:epoxyqueuosine reductase QueH [Salidesulfovibrio brasiliensis]|uniref:epoxyqueuosine reductase QueH n=1 Tax=Salidesulfovibrio brasiliensis TaxID=221711 RepID=UPI0006D1D246|nr:epoxyqueuosine reductase QueH [Salidesulfovibrio brasiliensis]
MDTRILLHICCGPCSISVIRRLQDQGYAVTGFFHNPNIHPLSEYLKRRDGCLEVAERLGIKAIVKDEEYDPKGFLRAVAWREDNRCFHCYAMRLERTVSIAKRGRFPFFTSTLLYSKMQKHDEIARLGKDMGGGKTAFHYEDFRTGWKEGIETSKEWGIYRQQYCGCIHSEFERYKGQLGKTEKDG